jgi:hypothetical protein
VVTAFVRAKGDKPHRCPRCHVIVLWSRIEDIHAARLRDGLPEPRLPENTTAKERAIADEIIQNLREGAP